MWFPHPSTPDYAYRDQERFKLDRSAPFEERYSNISGAIIHDKDTGSVRQINKYEVFYEDGIVEHQEIAGFVLDALAHGYTQAAPPLVLPNTKPGEHYKNGVTIYFFLDVPLDKFSDEAKKLLQQK